MPHELLARLEVVPGDTLTDRIIAVIRNGIASCSRQTARYGLAIPPLTDGPAKSRKAKRSDTVLPALSASTDTKGGKSRRDTRSP